MKRFLIIAFIAISGMTAKGQTPCDNMLFPTIDSLRSYINVYIRNSAVTAFTNLRLNTAMVGVTQWLECIQSTGGGGGTDNANVGTGYRILNQLTQELKTLAAGHGITIDSALSNRLRFSVDTAALSKTVLREGHQIDLSYDAPAIAGQDDTITVALDTNDTWANSLEGQFLYWDITRASSLTITSGKLEALNDLGTGNNDISIPVSGSRPSYYSGGPNWKPYVEVESGKTFGLTSAPSDATSPHMFFIICQVPLLVDGQRIFTYSSTGGGYGPMVNSNPALVFYNGVGFYAGNRPAARTEWMLLKVVMKDEDGFSIGVNNEPFITVDGAGTTAVTMTEFLFNQVPGIRISEVRGFDRLLSQYEELRLSQYFFDKYKLQNRYKTIIALGDSHTAGTMAGTTVTGGPYITRLQDSTFWRVYNFAVSGSVVDPFSNPALLATSLKNLYPDYNETRYRDLYFHFQYGTNDAANEGSATIDWPTWKIRYKAYIQEFLDIGVPPSHVSIGTPPYSTAAYPAGNLPDVVAAIYEIAEELGIVLMDYYQDMQDDGLDIDDVVGGDDIHGDAAVHQSMFETTRDALEGTTSVTATFTAPGTTGSIPYNDGTGTFAADNLFRHASGFRVVNTGGGAPGGISLTGDAPVSNTLTVGADFNINLSTQGAGMDITGAFDGSTSGHKDMVRIHNQAAFSSGTASHAQLLIEGNISQSGGANGITAGIRIVPTLSTPFDFRAIDLYNDEGHGIYQRGDNALNYMAGGLKLGATKYLNFSTTAGVTAPGIRFNTVMQFSNGSSVWNDIAPIASPTFTGTPAAPTAAPGTNTTQIATTAFVQNAISASTSGTHTPTLTNVTNVNGTPSANEGVYTRIGNVVTFSVTVSLQATAAGTVELGISLPVASDFSASYNASGNANSSIVSSATVAGQVIADATNNRLSLIYYAPDTEARTFTIHVTYKVVAP